MNDRILELSRTAEDYARNHVRDCETYGYTMFEGTAEDEFHAIYRNKFAELIVRECAEALDKNITPPSHPMNSVGWKLKQHFGVE